MGAGVIPCCRPCVSVFDLELEGDDVRVEVAEGVEEVFGGAVCEVETEGLGGLFC